MSDDWLEDDIGDYDKRPVKRMCGQFVGTHLRTVKNESTKSDRPSYPSANTSVRSPTRYRNFLYTIFRYSLNICLNLSYVL